MAVLNLEYLSLAIGHTVQLKVILPYDEVDYEKAVYLPYKPVKTLYLLHGLFGHENDWIYQGNIVELARRYKLAVVMPSGMNSAYVDNPDTMVKYGKFIGEELVEMTRKMFNLSPLREDTWIAGLSMGGYGALRNGLFYHETFSKICALSPAVTMDQSKVKALGFDLSRIFKQKDVNLKKLVSALKTEELPEIYIACGTEDFLIEANRSYIKFLKGKKIEHRYVESLGEHDWAFWRNHLELYLKECFEE